MISDPTTVPSRCSSRLHDDFRMHARMYVSYVYVCARARDDRFSCLSLDSLPLVEAFG